MKSNLKIVHSAPPRSRRSQKRQFRLELGKSGFDFTLKTSYVYADSVIKSAVERLTRGGTSFEVIDRETGRALASGEKTGLEIKVHVSQALQRGVVDHLQPLPWLRLKKEKQ